MRIILSAFLLGVLLTLSVSVQADPAFWAREWPNTDFSKSSVDFNDIMSGGPPKDGIPALDHPEFKSVSEIKNMGVKAPVIVVTYDGKAKAYPLGVLMHHEIANDVIGDLPITVTYCPLCNASIVFDRRLDGRILDFGVSGKLRYSDMVMYDRQTESWWQQFLGRGIVGSMTGKQLKIIPSRVMPFAKFKAEHPDGLVLYPKSLRGHGTNPYVKYDSSLTPFLYRGAYRGSIPALSYVVAIEKEAWPLTLLRQRKEIRHGNLVIRWEDGMNSALDTHKIKEGRDIGYVTVQREMPDGRRKDEVYDTTFAFAFLAFYPDGTLYTK